MNISSLFSRRAWLALIILTVVSVLVFGLCLLLALLQARVRTGPAEPAPTLALPTIVHDLPTSSVPTAEPGATPTSPPPTQTGSPYLPGLKGRIAFTCTRNSYNHICLINADGSGLVQLTDGDVNDYYPSLGVDGYVYFASQRTRPFTLYRVPAAGGKPQPVLIDTSLGEMSAPELSPDGNTVVFAAGTDGGLKQILRVNLDGQGLLYLAGTGHNVDPTWSPEGLRIAYAADWDGGRQLYVMDQNGNIQRKITYDAENMGGRSSWSPDGTLLAFYAGPDGDKDIYAVTIATSVITRLTDGGNNTGPCFSPDGEYIVFSSSREGDFELYIMRADGSDVRALTDNLGLDDWQPRWGR